MVLYHCTVNYLQWRGGPWYFYRHFEFCVIHFEYDSFTHYDETENRLKNCATVQSFVFSTADKYSYITTIPVILNFV